MNRRLLEFGLPTVVAAALCLSAWTPVSQEPGKREHAGEESPIHAPMEQMNGALRSMLKGGIDATSRDKALESLTRLQSGVIAAKQETPVLAATIEESKRAAFVTDFRKLLVEVLATTCKIETAVLEGKYDDANRMVKEDLGRLKKAGHDKFQGEDED